MKPDAPKRRSPISFRSDYVLREVQSRCAPGHESLQAKQDLIDYYGLVWMILQSHPQKKTGAEFMFKHYLKYGSTRHEMSAIGYAGVAFDVACARLKEIMRQNRLYLDTLDVQDYEDAGFRIL